MAVYRTNEAIMEKERMRLQLKALIEDWNSNRLDLFSLNEPDEDLEFHGVMRFYFQERGQKVATKCVRVSSTATTRAVIEGLVEKFHPDMKMLTSPDFSLWEVHENGCERRLAPDEKPLLVQLNWHKDDREGRFLLKREGEIDISQGDDANDPRMKRKLSRREKKEQKKMDKLQKFELNRQRREKSCPSSPTSFRNSAEGKTAKEFEDANVVGSRLYAEVPNNNFTRTISNPEIVMKKRRERKLGQRLKEMGEGGSLKIYGQDLSETKPYVTLLVSTNDRADKLVAETLEKYGLDWHDPRQYCLVEVRGGRTTAEGTPRERQLADHECPLLLVARSEVVKGAITFHVRRKVASDQTPVTSYASETHFSEEDHYRPGSNLSTGNDEINRPKNVPKSQSSDVTLENNEVPCLIEVNSSSRDYGRVFCINRNVTEVGNDPNLVNNSDGLYIPGPGIHPRHCVLANMDHVVTITPCSTNCQILINEVLVNETTILRNRDLIKIGQSPTLFRFTFSKFPDSNYTQPAAHRSTFKAPFAPSSAENRTYSPTNSISRQSMSSKRDFEQSSISLGQNQQLITGRDVIPAIVELTDIAEHDFISTLIRQLNCDHASFKLGPAYVIYMCCRYRVSPLYRTTASPESRALRLADFLTKITDVLHVTIQDYCHDSLNLSFWMSNCSELLNFLRSDLDLNGITAPEPQESLADAVQKAFDHLSVCFKHDLHVSMPNMLKLNVDDQTAVAECLNTFNECMQILRTCRINAALTIQLFSQLFHYVNMYLFNWLISREGSAYCCRRWGRALADRLAVLGAWAERQGLELAAECRLERIIQAAKLLQSSKCSIDDLALLSSNCSKLNSLQIRSLMERYRADPSLGENPVPKELVETLAKMAENQVDELFRQDGQMIRVEEDLDLQLPFLLPDDGYSPEVVRGLPPALREFVEILLQKGLCRMIMQPSSSGSWMVHFDKNDDMHCGSQTMLTAPNKLQNGPELVEICFEKGSGGIGLSIVQAQGQGQREPGIYVKKVVPNSAAFRDGRLQSGDQLLSVNGCSLIGISQDQAAQYMAGSGPVVSFTVAKGAAFYNGLATWMQEKDSSEMAPDLNANHQHHHRNGSLPVSPAPPPLAANYRVNHRPSSSFHVEAAPTSYPPELQREKSVSTLSLQRKPEGPHQSHYHAHQLPPPPPPLTSFPPREPPVRLDLRQNFQQNRNLQQETVNVPRPAMVRPTHPVHPPQRPHQLHSTSSYGSHHSNIPCTEGYYQNISQYRQVPQVSSTADSSPAVYSSEHQSRNPPPPYQEYNANIAKRNSQSRSSYSSAAHTTGAAQMQTPSPKVHIRQEPRQNFEKQIENEVERLLVEELHRLSSKGATMAPEERKRFNALKYELEYRQRLRSVESGVNEDYNNMRPKNTENREFGFESYADKKEEEEEDRFVRNYGGVSESLINRIQPEKCSFIEQNVNRHQQQFGFQETTFNDDFDQTSAPVVDLRPSLVSVSELYSSDNGSPFITTNLADGSSPVPPPAVSDGRTIAKNPVSFDSSTSFNDVSLSKNCYQSRKIDYEDVPTEKFASDLNLNSRPTETEPEPASVYSAPKKYVYDNAEKEVPRAQVLGAQEIYRDPRQKRLQHIQSSTQSRDVEGEKLSFKDKMKLFAKEVGESTPKDRLKASSAQREIESAMHH